MANGNGKDASKLNVRVINIDNSMQKGRRQDVVVVQFKMILCK